MTCRSCRRSVDGDAAFCPHCGTRLGSSSTVTPSLPGHEVLRLLAEDESRCTWAVRDESDGAERELVVCRSEDEETRQRFRRVARALRRSSARSLPRGRETGRLADQSPYLVREPVAGDRLAERLRHRVRLGAAEVAAIAEQVGEALEALAAAGVAEPAAPPEAILVRGSGSSLGAVLLEPDAAPLREAETAEAVEGTIQLGPDLSGRPRRPPAAVRELASLAWLLIAGRPAGANPDASAAPPASPEGDALHLLAEVLSGRAGLQSPRELSEALRRRLRVKRARVPSGALRPPAWAWPVAAAVLLLAIGLPLLLGGREEAPATPPPAPAPAADGLAAARRAEARGDAQGVVDSLSPDGEIPPDRQARRMLARALEELVLAGRASLRPRAVHARELVLAEAPDDPESLRARALLESAAGRPSAAVAWWDAALLAAAQGALDLDERVDLLVDAAAARALAGEASRAELLLAEALTLRPGHPRALANRGLLHLAAGRMLLAEQDLQAALSREPGLAAARAGLAEALRRQGREVAARAEAQAALASSPWSATARHVLALLHERSGRTAEAAVELERALERAPGDPRLEADLARVRAAGAAAGEATPAER